MKAKVVIIAMALLLSAAAPFIGKAILDTREFWVEARAARWVNPHVNETYLCSVDTINKVDRRGVAFEMWCRRVLVQDPTPTVTDVVWPTDAPYPEPLTPEPWTPYP